MKTPTLHKSLKSGFSLVELLVVIAVIAIIAAIAIPNIAGITGSASTSKNQRNAQTIASAFNAARAAGLNTPYATETLAADAVMDTLVGTGTATGGNGIPEGFSFGGLKLSDDERDAALGYLELTATTATGVFEYDPASTGNSTSGNSTSGNSTL